MNEITKKIKVGDNYILLNISEGYCTEEIRIEKEFFENGKLDKTITFSIWDDIQFTGWKWMILNKIHD